MIWVPDGESMKVEWYLSRNLAVGVENITDHWIRHGDARPQPTGFAAGDPERELPCDPVGPEQDERLR